MSTRMERPSPTSFEPDALFDLLADSRRRHLIALLREHDRTDRLFLDTLSARLAERETDGNEPADEIAITLHHNHLPKLEWAGLIRYDPRLKMVEFTGFFDEHPTSSLDIVVGDD